MAGPPPHPAAFRAAQEVRARSRRPNAVRGRGGILQILYHTDALKLCGSARDVTDRLDELCRLHPGASLREALERMTQRGRIASFSWRQVPDGWHQARGRRG